MNARTVLFILLGLVALVFGAAWLRHLLAANDRRGPTWLETAIGFVTNFFDTLGIGSFAPTTSIYRLKRLVSDELIPGTMNVGHTLPVIVQAFIYVTIIEVDPTTLVVIMVTAVLGGLIGANVVTRWPRRNIQIGMGAGLLAAGVLLVLRNLDELRGTPIFPGGEALGLTPPLLVLAGAISFVLGALLQLGIGYYAPCLIMISLMGMNPRAAFPIMMGACAFLMPIASTRFIARRRYAIGPALGLALGGIPAVLIAAFIIKELPLAWIRWLVVVVVLYTGVTLLKAATGNRQPATARET